MGFNVSMGRLIRLLPQSKIKYFVHRQTEREAGKALGGVRETVSSKVYKSRQRHILRQETSIIQQLVAHQHLRCIFKALCV